MTTTTKIYGICNAALFTARTKGDVTFFESAEERDAALECLREDGREAGLDHAALTSGIIPVELTDADIGDDAQQAGFTVSDWLGQYRDYADRPGAQAKMLDDVGL